MSKPIETLASAKLKEILNLVGISYIGDPRSELISKCKQAGIYHFNDEINLINIKKVNKSSVLIGNCAEYHNDDNKLVITNNINRTLINGEFNNNKVIIDNCLQLKSENFDCELVGEEGELRREGSQLFMYRTTDVTPGWYPIQFGSIKII